MQRQLQVLTPLSSLLGPFTQSKHWQHDGETDNRGPGDFSGSNAGKMDEGDEDEDEEEVAPVRTKRKKDAGKLKPPSDMNISNHNDVRTCTVPPRIYQVTTPTARLPQPSSARTHEPKQYYE